MHILTLTFKRKERYEKMLGKMKSRVLYTLEMHYGDKITGYIIAYIPIH